MSAKRILMSAVFSTTAFLPFAALAQTQEDCDLLMTEVDARQGQQIAVTRDQVTAFMQASDFAACRTALQQVQAQAQPGQAPRRGAAAGAGRTGAARSGRPGRRQQHHGPAGRADHYG
jgi:hypothetical protein